MQSWLSAVWLPHSSSALIMEALRCNLISSMSTGQCTDAAHFSVTAVPEGSISRHRVSYVTTDACWLCSVWDHDVDPGFATGSWEWKKWGVIFLWCSLLRWGGRQDWPLSLNVIFGNHINLSTLSRLYASACNKLLCLHVSMWMRTVLSREQCEGGSAPTTEEWWCHSHGDCVRHLWTSVTMSDEQLKTLALEDIWFNF